MDTITLGAILILGIVVIVGGYAVSRLVSARRRSVEIRDLELIDDQGGRHRIPRPPYLIPGQQITKANQYLTTVSIPELSDYIHQSLPDAGWVVDDISRVSLATAADFRQGDKRLRLLVEGTHIVNRGRLATKLTFTLAVNVKPSPLEQQLDQIRRLGKAGNKDAAEPLIELLSDPRAQVRREVVSALRVIGDKRAIRPLMNRLEDDDTQVKQLAALALGEFGGRQAVKALIAGLDSDDPTFQTNCAWSLGKIKDKRAAMALIDALERPYWKLKAYAAWALGEIGDTSAVEPLTACVKNTENDSKVRLMALVSLRKLVNEAEISYLLRQISVPSEPYSFGDEFKDAIAHGVAEVGTEAIFDFLGIEL